MKMKTPFRFIMAMLCSGVILLTGGCNLAEKLNPEVPSTDVPVLSTPDDVDNVAAAAAPAVVTITTKRSGATSSSQLFNDPFFRYFFGDSYGFNQEQEGLGTGFIISKDGYILTNEHVIDGASSISLDINDFEDPVEAKVIGADDNLDLALLKININKDLPYLKMGNSDQVRVGSWVIAIGSPYGLDHTVTVGVVSAKGRPVTVGNRQYENLLQTDTSINPGNSGGPLLNLNGEVIGINTAINAQAQGIGFAIPASTVMRAIEDLKNGTSAAMPWIGVQVRDVDDEAANYLGLAKTEGVLVTGVTNGSPAQKSGIEQFDVIIEFNGVRTNNTDQLIEAIRGTQVGHKVQILYFRDALLGTLEISVGERPKNTR